MQEHIVRHDGGAKNTYCRENTSRGHLWSNQVQRNLAPIWLNQGHLIDIGQANHGDQADNNVFDFAEAPLAQPQKAHHYDTSDNCRDEERNMKKNIEAKRSTKDFS